MIGRHDWMIPPLWQFVLASVVQLWLAVPFYKSAWASIKGGLANMDVLVTIGTVSVYLYSVYMLFYPIYTFFFQPARGARYGACVLSCVF